MAETSNLQNLVQRTLVLCKPDAIQRGIVGEIIQRFERVGLKIVGIKMVAPDAELYEKHYEEIGKLITRRGEQTFRYNLNYMLTGPVMMGSKPLNSFVKSLAQPSQNPHQCAPFAAITAT